MVSNAGWVQAIRWRSGNMSKPTTDVAFSNAVVERALLIRVEAWDVNCPRHIQERYTEAQTRADVRGLRQHIAALEEENRELRKALKIDGPGT